MTEILSSYYSGLTGIWIPASGKKRILVEDFTVILPSDISAPWYLFFGEENLGDNVVALYCNLKTAGITRLHESDLDYNLRVGPEGFPLSIMIAGIPTGISTASFIRYRYV